MRGIYPLQRDVAFCNRSGNHQRSGYDSVRDNPIRTRNQFANAFNRNRIGTCADNFGAHGIQKKFCRSWISGSLAALVIVVIPRAVTAAIIMFSVAPTLG